MATEARPKDTRPYITLTNEYPRHRKIRGLSDAAFRLHVTLLAIANEDRMDGHVQAIDLESKGPKAKKELLDAGLVEIGAGGYVLHDYLEHQNSSDEIEERIQEKRKRASVGGKVSAHNRHHVERGIVSDDCELCQKS